MGTFEELSDASSVASSPFRFFTREENKAKVLSPDAPDNMSSPSGVTAAQHTAACIATSDFRTEGHTGNESSGCTALSRAQKRPAFSTLVFSSRTGLLVLLLTAPTGSLADSDWQICAAEGDILRDQTTSRPPGSR